MTICPLRASATPLATSEKPRSVILEPPLPKLVSSWPSDVYRARPMSSPAVPTATIFPSGWIASAVMSSSWPLRSVVTIPSWSKLVSSVPSALYRTSAKSLLKPEASSADPATTILPLDCTATALAPAPLPKNGVVTIPPLPKFGFGVPSDW